MRMIVSLTAALVFIVSPSFGTKHTVGTSGFTFSPSSLTITAGDTVIFSLSLMHNAVEVSQTTWNANDTTHLPGGFGVPFGGGTVVITGTGTHYYVCQAHASLGMKGTIVVNAFVPNTITIENTVDQDGNLATAGDRIPKNWNLRLYHDAVLPANLVGEVASGLTLTVGSLPSGTYIAFESDSAGWTSAGVLTDGSPHASSTHQWSLGVTSGESHTVTFLNTAPDIIISSGFTFVPDSLDVDSGATVRFVLDPMHTAREVSSATWLADDTLSNGGFDLPFGGGSAVITGPGTHYYVCVPHASIGMKGRIVAHSLATNAITIDNIVDRDGNPGTTGDRLPRNWGIRLYRDSVAPGNLVAAVASGVSLTADSLLPGTYIAFEEDSAGWSPAGVIVDDTAKNVLTHQWNVTVSSNENRTITFLNTAPRIIMSSGFTFVPDSILVGAGDTVQFVLDPMHTAREVSGATWLANDTLSNGGFDLPSGGGAVVLTDPGTHYYVCVPHASIGMKGRIIIATTVARGVIDGWNMISLPVEVFDSSAAALYPTAVSTPFSYQGLYQSQSVLTVGLGYWLKFDHSQQIPVSGFVVPRDTLHAQKGWNMIGSVTSPVPAAAIGSVPPGIIISGLFGYDGGYVLADTIVPGYGYWVKLSQDGSLVLDPGGVADPLNKRGGDGLMRSANRLVLSDAAGRMQTLYFMRPGSAPPLSGSRGELPPPPPGGGFDARFAGDELICVSEGDSAGGCPIEISGALFPVRVAWEVRPSQEGFFLLNDGKAIALHGAGAVELTARDRSLSLNAGGPGAVPREFALGPAFPNPFNPSTTIEFRVPEESRVVLSVYNLLGQLQAELVSGVRQAGTWSVAWNGERNASGVYFIRFEAAALREPGRPFVRFEKVVLQK